MTRDVAVGFLFSLIFHGGVLWYVARIQNDLVPPQSPPPILTLHLSSTAPSTRSASLHGDKAESPRPSTTDSKTVPVSPPARPQSQKKGHTVIVKNQLQREKRPGETVKVRPITEQTSHETPIVPPRVIEKAPEVPAVSHSVIDHPVLAEKGVDNIPQFVEEKATPALQPTAHEVPVIPPRVIDMAQVPPIATYDVIDHPVLLEESVGKMPQLLEEKGRPVFEQIPQRKAISLPKAIQASLDVPIPIHGLIQQNAPLEKTLGGIRPLSEGDKGIGTGRQAYAPDRGTNKVVEAKPNYAINPKPLYPKRAIRRGYEGTVTLLVEVLSNGSVRYVEIVGSSGYPILDRSAQKTVRKWRFIPGKRGEKPVTMKVKVPVVFRLKKGTGG